MPQILSLSKALLSPLIFHTHSTIRACGFWPRPMNVRLLNVRLESPGCHVLMCDWAPQCVFYKLRFLFQTDCFHMFRWRPRSPPHVQLICIFLKLDLDYLCACRTAPYHSWKTPVERVMSDLSLQCVGVSTARGAWTRGQKVQYSIRTVS